MTTSVDSQNGQKVRLHDRLAWQLGKRIRKGDWPAGAKIPSIRQLADEYKIAPATVGHAIKKLQEAGFVVCRPNSGSYVTSVNDLRQSRGLEPIDDMLLDAGRAPEPADEGAPVVRGKTLHFLFHLETLRLYTGSFYPEVLCLMQEEAEAAGLTLRIGNTDQLEPLIAQATPETTAGVLYMPDGGHPFDLAWPAMRVPRVLLGLGAKSADANYVTPNNYGGGHVAAERLAPRCRGLACLVAGGESRSVLQGKPFEDRFAGVRDYCQARGFPAPSRLDPFRPGVLAAKLADWLLLPRDRRPGLLLLGDWPREELEERCGELPVPVRPAEEFEVALFQDFDTYTPPEYHAIAFCRRTLCREVVQLALRAGRHPGDQPLTVGIPMRFRERSA